MYRADSWSTGNMYYGPAYVITGVLYFILCYPLANLARKLEKMEKKQIPIVVDEQVSRIATIEGGM